MSNRRVCVLDAGPIIHLDELGAVDLLRTLGELFIPESVAWEAEKHRPGVRAKIDRHIVEDVEGMTFDLTLAVAREELHAGEIAALA